MAKHAVDPRIPGGISNTQECENFEEFEDFEEFVNQHTQQVELKISCRDLADKDFFSESDPFVVLFTKANTKSEWRVFDQTETLQNNLNPDFVRSFKMDYIFEEQQYVKFEVYDQDASTNDLSKQDFIGKYVTTLGSIIGENNGRATHTLQEASAKDHETSVKYARKSLGTIIICAEAVSCCKDKITLSLYGRNLDKKDLFGKSDPYLEIQSWNKDKTYPVVHRTEVIKNSLNPDWKTFTIDGNALCNGDYERYVRVLCFDWNRNGSSDLIGQFDICARDLKNWNSENSVSFDLINTKEKEKKKNYINSGVIYIQDCKIVEEPTFLDFIKNGLELNFVVAIDFAKSNTCPAELDSLHSKVSHASSQYVQSLEALGAVIEDYDTDKLFPAFGFGAKLPPGWDISHNFPLNLDPENPYCQGVSGVIDAYHYAINTVLPSGQTHFSPIISKTSQITGQALQKFDFGSQYFVLLIITDGTVMDMEDTKKAIVEAASLPISIIIVGIGSADFDEMNELDGDQLRISYQGSAAARDIVQFVPFRDYLTGDMSRPFTGSKLAKDLLRELPDQVTEYMKQNNIKPVPDPVYS